MTTLTDEQIDELSGRELDEVVAIASGWKQRTAWIRLTGSSFTEWRTPDGQYVTQVAEFNLGSAMDLLLNSGRWVTVTVAFENKAWIVEVIDLEVGDHDPLRLLASGPKEQAAQTICRAYLKLKNRSNGR